VLAVAYSMLVEDDSEVSGFDIGRHALLQKVVGAAGQLGTADPGAHLAAFNGMVGALRPQTHQGAGGNDPSDATPLGTQGHLGPRPWPFA
jgi:hypothetical protein